MTSLHEVALLRLAAQRIAGPGLPSALDVVRLLTATQGQDYPGALISVALRTTSRLRKEVEAALDAGDVVRSWPMRGTLHLVAAEDLPWMLELLGPRVIAGAAKRRERLGLTEADAERARAVAVAALTGGRRLGRAPLLAALAAGGVDVSGQRGYHLLWYLSQTGSLCLGPTQDGEQMFVLLEEWVTAPRRLDREEALAELVRRYFTGHGPATVADLVRWAGTTVRDVRTGLTLAQDDLDTLDVDGDEYFLAPETPELLAECRAEARGTFLLPGFDEFVLGYGDRRAILEPEFADRIVPGGNGMFRSTVVVDGRIAGTWQWTGRGAKRAVTAEPFTAFPEAVGTTLPRLAASLP